MGLDQKLRYPKVLKLDGSLASFNNDSNSLTSKDSSNKLEAKKDVSGQAQWYGLNSAKETLTCSFFLLLHLQTNV